MKFSIPDLLKITNKETTEWFWKKYAKTNPEGFKKVQDLLNKAVQPCKAELVEMYKKNRLSPSRQTKDKG